MTDRGKAGSRLGPQYVNTPSTLPRVAKIPMVMRSVRVPEALWEQAKAKADERHESISDVVREALERYVKARDDTGPR